MSYTKKKNLILIICAFGVERVGTDNGKKKIKIIRKYRVGYQFIVLRLLTVVAVLSES